MHALPRLTLLCLALLAAAPASVPAESALEVAIEVFRQARGQAIARENQLFLRRLESALATARQQKNEAEAARIASLIDQLRRETDRLLEQGDTRALRPTDAAQLRAFLVGTAWSFNQKADEVRVFQADGQFRAKTGSIPYSVIGPRQVHFVWAPNTRIDCEFNEDFTEMRELGGMRSVWRRVPTP